jgi:hypothetical protein
MKKIFVNNRIIAIAFFTVFSVASTAVLGNDGSKVLPVELKYTGHVNNQPLYKLIINGNKAHDEFIVIIRSANKEIIYSENIKGENFTKSFLLNTEEMGDDTLHFEIVSKNTKKSVTYDINRNTHLEEEVVIGVLK